MRRVLGFGGPTRGAPVHAPGARDHPRPPRAPGDGLDHDAARLAADYWDDRRSPASTGPVTVVRDCAGIIQITADNPHDLFLAQGYVHAQERMWQMEISRRIGAGRLSELFGESQVDRDRYIRTLGWRVAAERDLAAMSPETVGHPPGLCRRRECLDRGAPGSAVDAVRRRRASCRAAAGSAASSSSRGRRSTPPRGRRSRRGRSAATSIPRSSGSSPTPGSVTRRARTSCSRRTTPIAPVITPGWPARALAERAPEGAAAAGRTDVIATAGRSRSQTITRRRSRDLGRLGASISGVLRPRRRRGPRGRATGSARTTGSSRASTPEAASRSSRTTRISASGCPRSGS